MLPIPLEPTRVTESLAAERRLCEGVRRGTWEGGVHVCVKGGGGVFVRV